MVGNQGMIGVDVGGTFTDCVSIEDGVISATKVRTDYVNMEAPVIAGAKALDVSSKGVFNHASTAGLNAVITRSLPKIAYLTTSGHRDLLDMGRAWRPMEALTDAHWRRPFGDAMRPLIPRYLRRGVVERVAEDGSELIALDEAQARTELEVLKRCGVTGVAICLINAYVNADHEVRLRELVHEVLGAETTCSISSEVSPLAKEYARASTTVIDVYMKIIFKDYSEKLLGGLAEAGFENKLNFADCAATLAPVDFAIQRPYRIIFSGPAAGTVSTAHLGSFIGVEDIICCDVGGTSTDLSVVTGGEPIVDTTFEIEHDLIVNTLANEIATIGAGGGSIVAVGPGGELQVGPESAGSDPGPACYPDGGTEPTMTDACLMIGILDEGAFLGGQMKLDRARAEAAFEALDTSLPLGERVEYAYRIGLNNISEGIVNITVKNGVDPRDYAIMAYGSAGPMLIPAVLDLVHAKSVIVPPHPGEFSALGLLSTDLVYADSRSAYVVLDGDSAERISEVFEQMEENLLGYVSAERDEVKIQRTLDGRYVGQTWDTPFVPVPDGKIGPAEIEQLIADFHDSYERRWGNRFPLPVEGVTYRVQVIVPSEKVDYLPVAEREGALEATRTVRLRHLGEEELEAGEFQRVDLCQGDRIEGPAIIREEASTTQVCVGQVATVGRFGEIVITRQ